MNVFVFHPVILEAAAAETKFAIFDSGFLITVAIIVFSTLLIAFIKHLKKDKCIKNFKTDVVTIYFNDGKNIKGRLDVENTGSELIVENPDNGMQRSYIIYKSEYSGIRFFARFHKDLDARRSKARKRVVKKTYHPNILRRIRRKINIFFKIIRDSMMEIFTALSGRIKTTNASYASNEKYVANVNKEVVSSVDDTYNPLLEKYIGNLILCTHTYNNKEYAVHGILKEYTGEYLELLDAELKADDISITMADLVLPRTANKVRSLGEEAVPKFSLPKAFNLNLYKKKLKKSSHEKNEEDKKKQ